jgi:lysyl-tRNA synthetase class 1
MLWFDDLAGRVEGPQIVNDSKTPSGPVHVGSLRGVLIHDAVYRALGRRGVPATYRFGVDDYDPLDELPPVGADEFRQYLGMPLCNVPAPAGSDATDLAEHYIRDLFDAFGELGVGAETYRMRDIYRSGAFDEEIDTILAKADVVRRIDREVANARRDDDWYPFQVICENCGRIGTTKVYDYDGSTVAYRCLPNLVTWAAGCGHAGRISPFSGNGKLSWKLEWVAKWNHFPVTIEGAGKDHNSRGGSREVAVRCLEEVFGRTPPLNIPYEFFLVGGAKMSSSKGVGVSLRDMLNLLPPDVLRFLMVRAQPRQTVDFAPTQEKIVRLLNDFDRVRLSADASTDADAKDVRLHDVARVSPEPPYYAPPFDLVLSLVQMPHVDLRRKVEELKGSPLSPSDLRHLEERVASARYWLTHFAGEEDRLELQPSLPAAAAGLAPTQAAFLHRLADDLAAAAWEGETLQGQIFSTARLTPIQQGEAFQAIYLTLFGRRSGPRAGNILAFLDRTFVLGRFREVPMSVEAFWRDSAVPEGEVEAWLEGLAGTITGLSAHILFDGTEVETVPGGDPHVRAMGVIDFVASLQGGRAQVKRCCLETFDGATTLEEAKDRFSSRAMEYVKEIGSRLPVSLDVVTADGKSVRGGGRFVPRSG